MLDLNEAREKGYTTEISVEKEGELTCIILMVWDGDKVKLRDCRKYSDSDIATLKELL